MKRSLLTACVVLAISASAQPTIYRQAPDRNAVSSKAGTESLDFCYCGNMGIAPEYVDGGTPVSGAMYIPASEASRLKGNTLEAISVFAGYDSQTMQNTIPTATVWLTYDLDETPFSSTTGDLSSTPLTYNSIQLDEPYMIEGDKGFYVGYTVTPPSNHQVPIIFDNYSQPHDWGGWYKIGDNPWINQSSVYGFVLIKATITGDNLPLNAAGIYSSKSWSFAFPGEKVENNILLINMGARSLETVTLEVTVGDGTPVRTTYSVDSEVNYNDLYRVYADATIDRKGNNVPVKIKVAEVNGQPNEYMEADSEVTNYVLCLDEGEGFSRNVVMEQGTSLTQGGSPMGIVANRIMTKTYGSDKTFIPVMVHMYDELSGEGYDEFFTSYLCTKIPSVIPNRMLQFSNTRAGYDEVESVYEQVFSMPAFSRMAARVTQDETDPTILNVATSTWFLDDCEGEWRLAYVVRRDNVGPISQANYYSLEDADPNEEPLGEMGGFENEPDPCDIMHDNVAVLIEDYYGIPESVPASVKKGEEYVYEHTLHIDEESQLKNTTIIVYLINSLNGSIDQAVAVPYSEFETAGIASASESGAVEVSGLKGALRVAGDFKEATVYDMAGMKIATLDSTATISLSAGMYIVTVDGSARKVIVK